MPVVLLGQWDSLKRSQIDTFSFGRKPYIFQEKLRIDSSVKIYFKDSIISSYKIAGDTLILFEDQEKYEASDSFFVSYKYYFDPLPDSLGRSYTSGIESKVTYITLDIPQNNSNEPFIPQGLNYSGSFGRGLTAGNSQSLVLNSNFNMQLGGQIGDGIDLRAVISDANIPIQAEGTTQQLQEFDQVFIELSKDQQSLVAGDYRLEKPTGYFVNYSKKLKGLKYSNNSIYSQKNGNLTVSGSFAISGGKFSRNNLATTEGNQGPYKLQGADNEQFIIVQSGSEKVYLDGELLVRGENNDYVIFYDRAEIIFTEKRPITKDSRIIIDFEYLVQNYARTISTANASWTNQKHDIKFRLYDESDNKNSTGNFELSNEDRQFLSNAGDDPNNNFQSGIFFNPEFEPNSIFYRLVTTIEGDTILEYSTNSSEALYQSVFTDLGEGMGDYSIDEENNINGRVYKYVGKNQGRYSAVRKLIPPERKQLISLSDEFSYHENGTLMAEVALSNFDKNLFSDIDREDDISYALRGEWNQRFFLTGKSIKNVKNESLANSELEIDQLKQNSHRFDLFAYGEYLASDFQFLNPFRNAEFNRDWNLALITDKTDEILAGAGIHWNKNCENCRSNKQNIKYTLSSYTLPNLYSGIKQNISSELSTESLKLLLNSSYLQSSSNSFNSSFLRPQGSIDRSWKKLKSIRTGVSYDGEYNNKKDAITDTLLLGSNEYDVLKIYVESDEKSSLKAGLFYSKRYDRIAFNNNQETFSIADNYGTNFQWSGKNQSANMNLTYRLLETEESLEQSVKDAETFLGGIDYQYSLWGGIVRGVSNFNFNSGQEPKREFDYREVAPGEGNFVWIDDGDGIKDKNEFQIAPFSDQGNYIQVSLFNNEFIQVYKQDYVQTLRVEAAKWKLSKKTWQKTLSKLSSQTSLRLTRKDLQENGLPDFQFYVLDETNEDLVSFVSSINQRLFWNRGNPSYDIVFNYLENTSSLLLTTGNEIRTNENYSIKYRQNILKKAEVELRLAQNTRGLKNINFTNNNYLISGWSGELNSSYRYEQKLAFTGSFVFETKANTLSIETANSLKSSIGVSYSSPQKMRVDGSFSIDRINYVSNNNPTIELIMLEGLKDGNNYLWEIRFTRRLINNFDLSINYNGRKTGTSKIIHVANAQIKATF